MNILFINPPIRLSDKPRHIPHGLAIIAGVIRRKIPGATLRFLDVNAHRYSDEKVRARIAESGADVVLTGGLIPVFGYITRLSRWVKDALPDAFLAAGGSAAMSVPELLLNHSHVDAVCTGEGEHTAVELVRALAEDRGADLSEIAGLAFRGSDGEVRFTPKRPLIEDLDAESGLPAYDLLPMEVYLNNNIIGLGRDVDFISGRGCPFNCTFCYQPWGRRFRSHSVDFIADAMKHLRKDYGVDFVSFQDDEFMAVRKRVFAFCDRRNRDFPEIRWSCTGRANLVDDAVIGAVTAAGNCLVSYGFESGSPRMLKSMKKAVTTDQMARAVALNRRHGLPIPVSFILGMPGEDEESCGETVKFCIENNLHLESLMFATPYPGTELFDFAVQTGRIRPDGMLDFVMKLGDARDFVVNLTDAFTDQALQEKWTEMKAAVRAHYKPLPADEVAARVKKLYGPLADRYFALSGQDQTHRASHGAIDLF